ncbi:MAG TPA: helix-turn-helix domain-containing protein [Thermoanaerobaculia bacterium]|jgi:transcriptional regulator with XRE-family HTH domain|nr:helix-turn-helix domain-containing protein [Thermoanaerobaculia bacterium]
MARLGDPADVRLVVCFLRSLRKWSQEQFARTSGVDRGLISDYELGAKVPRRRTLERLAVAVGLPYSWVETLLPIFREARLESEERLAAGVAVTTETEVTEKAGAGLEGVLVEAVLPRLTPFLMELEALGSEEPIPAGEERARARALCDSLLAMPFRRWRVTVEREPKYWTWAVAERLCAESERAAAHRADQAVVLARLALRVAELVAGSESSRLHLEGYIWGFLANALRVQGDLSGADEAFLSSDRLSIARRPADPDLLDGSRLLDLKASLRRQQGRQAEACALLDKALAASSTGEGRARILFKKSMSSTRRGHYEDSIDLLRQAEALIDGVEDRRLPWLVSFSLASNLGHLGKYKEAEALLPTVRQSAEKLKNELDLKRLRWLEGRVAAGLGRREQALAALEEVKRYFTEERIAFDAALASLEVAVLYLEEGRTREVKILADEMLWIFEAQGVAEEALAAIRLFYEAATREEATAELARQTVELLRKAQL